MAADTGSRGVAEHLVGCRITISGSAAVPEKGTSKHKVYYVIQCEDQHGYTWTCDHRFSQFVTFREKLIAAGATAVADGGKITFPRKTAGRASAEQQKLREAGLQTWLNTVVRAYSDEHTVLIQDFLQHEGLARVVEQHEYPVHDAIRMHAPLTDLLALLEEHPGACEEQDMDGNVPLAVALLEGAEPRVVLHILARNPAARRLLLEREEAHEAERKKCEQDREQRLSQRASASAGAVTSAAAAEVSEDPLPELADEDDPFVEMSSAVVGLSDHEEIQHPLHLAARLSGRIEGTAALPLEMVETLCAEFRADACSELHGALPLHTALEQHQVDWDTVRCLLRSNPNAASKRAPLLPFHQAVAKGCLGVAAARETVRLLLIANPAAALEPVPGHPFPAGFLDTPIRIGVIAQAFRRDRKADVKGGGVQEWGRVIQTHPNGNVVMRWLDDNKVSGEEWYGDLEPVFKDTEAQSQASLRNEDLQQMLRGPLAAIREFKRAALLTKMPPFVHLPFPAAQRERYHVRVRAAVANAVHLAKREQLPAIHLAVALCGDVPETVQHFCDICKDACNTERDFRGWLPIHRAITQLHSAAGHSEREIMPMVKLLTEKTDAAQIHITEQMFGGRMTTAMHMVVDHGLYAAAMLFVHSAGATGAVEFDPQRRDSQNRSVIELAKASASVQMKRWGYTHDAYLGRYTIEERPIHKSRTALVFRAVDQLREGESVILKLVKEWQSVQLEVTSRLIDGISGCSAVIAVLRYHTPPGHEGLPHKGAEPECTDEGSLMPGTQIFEYPYVLVLCCGERSLHETCANENLALNDVEGVPFCLQSLWPS
jgi:hypothetical protein